MSRGEVPVSRREVIEVVDGRPARRRRSATGWRRLFGAAVLALSGLSGVAWWWAGTPGQPTAPREPAREAQPAEGAQPAAPARPAASAAAVPEVVLAGVRLGESRDDVVARKGRPVRERGSALETADGAVVLLDAGRRVEAVIVDCAQPTDHALLAIRCGTPVERLEKALGQPERIATSTDGTRRTYAWGRRHVAFVAAQAKVSMLILYADDLAAVKVADVPAR